MQFSIKIQAKFYVNIKKIFWSYIELRTSSILHASPYLGLYALSEEQKKEFTISLLFSA